MDTYLVFEAQDPPQAGGVTHTQWDAQGRPVTVEVAPERVIGPIPYLAVAAVKATDENAAATTVARATRRLSRYMVIKAVAVTFGDDSTTPDAERPVLNA